MNTYLTLKIPTKFNESTVDVLIDADDECLAVLHPWRISSDGYVRWKTSKNGKTIEKRLHRLVLKLESNTWPNVDHINGDKLDNRKVNLRIANGSQNNYNNPKIVSGASKYKGVFWHRPAKNWYAQITYRSSRAHLWQSTNEDECAYAYDYAALCIAKQFAYLNGVVLAEHKQKEIEQKVRWQVLQNFKLQI